MSDTFAVQCPTLPCGAPARERHVMEPACTDRRGLATTSSARKSAGIAGVVRTASTAAGVPCGGIFSAPRKSVLRRPAERLGLPGPLARLSDPESLGRLLGRHYPDQARGLVCRDRGADFLSAAKSNLVPHAARR